MSTNDVLIVSAITTIRLPHPHHDRQITVIASDQGDVSLSKVVYEALYAAGVNDAQRSILFSHIDADIYRQMGMQMVCRGLRYSAEVTK